MMAAPPCDQHHESADDSENGSFRHFFTHLVRMRERIIDCDLRDSALVTRTYRVCALAGSQSICSRVCLISNCSYAQDRRRVVARHYASAGFVGATKERIPCPSSELDARGKRAPRSWLRC